MTEEKVRALGMAVYGIAQKYGTGAIMFGDYVPPPSENIIPTGIKELDKALGIGGLPMGRVVEIYGPEDGGKSALALQVIRKLPADRPALYIDADHHLSPSMLTTIGVKHNKVYLLNVDTLEAAMEACKLAAKAFGVIVVDSLTALPTKGQAAVDMGTPDSATVSAAQIMAHALPTLGPILHKTGCTVILISQLREKPGIMYGNPEYSTGGKAIKFYSAVRLEVRRVEVQREKKQIGYGPALGQMMRVKVVKNKCAPPYRQAEIYLGYERGFRRRTA